MTTDDTSREALIESLRGSLANVLCNASNFPRKAMPYILGADMRPLIDKAAAAVVDAVVLPLVQERDAARAEALRVDEANTRMGLELTTARAEAWERGYMFAFAQERGDHTRSRPVPDYLADDIRSWNPYITGETP